MKKAKPVIIYQRASQSMNLFQRSLFLGLMFLFLILGLSLHTLPHTTVVAQSSSSAMTSQAIPYFPSPRPEEVPFTTLPLASFLESTATQAATPQTDYCVDVPILMYHHTQPLEMAELLGHAPLTVDSNIFDEQIKYLVDNGYTLLSADEFISALKERRQLPPKSVLITVDDGYDDNYTYAFMTAKKYHVIINFMIPTGLIGKPGYMTWDHVKEMYQSPYAKLYNHTWTHAELGPADQEKIELEITTSQKDFEEKLGYKPNIFTYPYGSYSDLAIDIVKREGFIAAFTTEGGTTQCQSNIMKLYRLHIGNEPLSGYGF